MAKIVSIKLTKAGYNVGPFNIYDQSGNLIAQNVPKSSLESGMNYTVADSVTLIRLVSVGERTVEKVNSLVEMSEWDFYSLVTEDIKTGCLWRHLRNPEIYNTFYGSIAPYIIEYPFAYQYYDEILQNVKDYSKVYKYTADEYGVTDETAKVEINDGWFNKAILYNGQQCSGLLNLVQKPLHNLKSYMSYPIYGTDNKTILYTKSDNFYNYNTFWSVVKDRTQPLFTRTCKPLSYDKELNQTNMDYSTRSFKKEPLRAKDLRIRHILDNRDDIKIVSQIVYAPTQISYK